VSALFSQTASEFQIAFLKFLPSYSFFSPSMRLLRIKFENLNSLPSGDIDLAMGAPAGAGIFAVTGPTGAEKATLLDAVTLALYGRAACHDKEPNPENMMSGDTGACHAEVLFEVPCGRYLARWELRRALGKADGALQAATRTVAEDGTGTVLAEKNDEADRLVEELTGLDYERFRRSALLAQEELAAAESAQREAVAQAERAASALQSLLKGRTAEEVVAEGARLDAKRVTLTELRAAMDKRDGIATEASRLANEETQLVGEIEVAVQEHAAMAQEAEAQAALLEAARAGLEMEERIADMGDRRAQLTEGQPCPLSDSPEPSYGKPDAPFSPAIEEARRNLKAAKTANDSAVREARLAAEGVRRLEERLSEARKRRGELRWQQAADHELFEKLARSVRIFTPEALVEALEALEKSRATHEKLVGEIHRAVERKHAAEEAVLTVQGALAQLREKLAGGV